MATDVDVIPDNMAHSLLAEVPCTPAVRVELADGSTRGLDGMTVDELLVLQWEQERQFAARIVAAPKGSDARTEAVCRAYDTITTILASVVGTVGQPIRMGLHPRQERLVLDLLTRQRRSGMKPRFFEIGYASGFLLARVRDAGFPVAGIEASGNMRQQALRLLGPDCRDDLLVGDFLRCKIPRGPTPISLAYWNDVFEHIPPDEILDYLRRIRELLCPGGRLVTITPNWHMRPHDITCRFRGPRAEPEGVHLKEYTLREVTSLLREAGFTGVATPLCVLPDRLILCGRGLAGWKRGLEPLLESLPFRVARFLCRGFALSTTIAVR